MQIYANEVDGYPLHLLTSICSGGETLKVCVHVCLSVCLCVSVGVRVRVCLPVRVEIFPVLFLRKLGCFAVHRVTPPKAFQTNKTNKRSL